MASIAMPPSEDPLQAQTRLLAEVALDSEKLRSASASLRGDRDFVLRAVGRRGSALEFGSEALRSDRELVLAAVKQSGSALQHASSALRGDREVVLAAVRSDSGALEYASEELRNDREVVLEAVQKCWWALGHAKGEPRKDREVVLEAVRQHGWALEYADPVLRKDPLVVMRAVRSGDFAVSVKRLAKPQNMCDEPSFMVAASCRLASPGERAPVLFTTLEWSPDRSEILCEACLLSGLQLRCALRGEASVADLAQALQHELSKEMVTKDAAYIHVQLDGLDAPLSPFECERAVAEFLQ